MPIIISSILSIISSVVGGVTEEQKAKIALELQANDQITRMAEAQLKVNAAEAASNSIFVAGWRPFIGWVCGCAFAWVYLLQPMITYFCVVSGHPVPSLPNLGMTDMMPVLMGMLGLGGFRTYEKTRK